MCHRSKELSDLFDVTNGTKEGCVLASLLFSRFQFTVSPVEFLPFYCVLMTNVALRSECCGCQRELLVALVFSQTPAASYRSKHHRYVTLLRQKESAFWSKLIDAQQSQPRQLWQSFDKLLGQGKNPLSSDIDASASISSSTTRLPVFGQLLCVLMNLGSLQPRSGVSSVSLLQSHRLRSLRWCWLCLTSSACLTLCRRGYSRRATTCLRRSCAGCSVGASTTALFLHI